MHDTLNKLVKTLQKDYEVRCKLDKNDIITVLPDRQDLPAVRLWVQQIRSNLLRVSLFIGGWEAASHTFLIGNGEVEFGWGKRAIDAFAQDLIAKFGVLTEEA